MHAFLVLLRLALPLALIAYLGFGVAAALRSGVSNAVGSEHRRRENTVVYWSVVVIQTLLTIAIALGTCKYIGSLRS
jgi:uncharacterized membrane protein YczE